MEGVTTVIMAGGQGARLYPLTKDRAKPSVPFAGKYRLIDIAMSNCLHSDLDRVFILTQFNSASLNRHISETYQMGAMSRFYVQILAAEQTHASRDWYQGTADSVRKNLLHVFDQHRPPKHFLILAGDHFYRADYRRFLNLHINSDADVSIGVIPVPVDEASRFGVLKIDERQWIRAFVEKPSEPEQLADLATEVEGIDPADGPHCLASMGIYVIKAEVLRELLTDSDDVDFGHDVIPKAIHSHKVLACTFGGYWEDIGTIDAFYNANMDLLRTVPDFDFYDETAPIFTNARQLPNVKVNQSHVWASMIAEGSILDRSEVRGSIVGIRSKIAEGSELDATLLMGADFYESDESIRYHAQRGVPRIGVGRNCTIRRAIIDKNARLGDGVQLLNEAGLDEADSDDRSWFIRDGIIVVSKNAVIPDGTIV